MKLWNKEKHAEILGEIEKYEVGKDYIYDAFLAKYDVLGTIGHVKGLKKIGVLSEDEALKMLAELDYLYKDFSKEAPRLSVRDEDIHTYIENYLVNRLGKVAEKLHTGRSRNDQSLTMLRLYEKDKLSGILADLDELLKTLSLLMRTHKENKTPFIGYTHSRQAMPITFAFYLESIIEALEEDRKFMRYVQDFIDKNVLGTAAGYGVPLDIDRKFLKDVLGFSDNVNNALYAQNTRGKYESMILDALSYLMGDLARFASDIILFSSDELGFVELSAQITTGSSIMPHKKNPDVLELVRAKSKKIFAASNSVKHITFSINSGYSRDLQEIKELMVDSFEDVENSVRVFRIVLENMNVCEDKVFEKMSKKVFSLDISLELTKQNDMTFREAYKVVGDVLLDLEEFSEHELVTRYREDDIKLFILDFFKKDIKELFYFFISKRKIRGYPNF